jgi:hypothetical protein
MAADALADNALTTRVMKGASLLSVFSRNDWRIDFGGAYSIRIWGCQNDARMLPKRKNAGVGSLC